MFSEDPKERVVSIAMVAIGNPLLDQDDLKTLKSLIDIEIKKRDDTKNLMEKNAHEK